MKKVAVLLMVVVLGVAMMATVAFACQNHQNPSVHYCPKRVHETVVWTALPWLSLSIGHSSTDLQNVYCTDSKEVQHGNYLVVKGNIDWQLTASVSGRISGHHASYYLSIALDPSQGTASDLCGGKKVWINYHLRNLSCLPPGDYTAMVTYTVTAR